MQIKGEKCVPRMDLRRINAINTEMIFLTRKGYDYFRANRRRSCVYLSRHAWRIQRDKRRKEKKKGERMPLS